MDTAFMFCFHDQCKHMFRPSYHLDSDVNMYHVDSGSLGMISVCLGITECHVLFYF